MRRRSFLRRGLWASSAVALAPTILSKSRAADPSPRRPKVGFLGVAYSHAAEKIRLLRASSEFEFVGVWAETEALASKYREQGVAIRSRDEILRLAEVAVVESEVATHATLALEALEAGCHVHLEKPPAETMADFDRVLAAARERKRLLQVGYMWRLNPGLNAVFEAVRSGWLGEVFLVRATINNTLETARRREWAGFKGGVLFELGSHMLDAVVRLLGKPNQVVPVLKTHGSSTDTLADNNVVVLEYPKTTAVISSSTLQPNAGAHRAFEVLGTRGTAVVRPLEQPVLELDLAEAAGPYSRGRQTVPLPAYRRYEGEFAQLASSLREDRVLAVTLEQERDVQETLLKACGVGVG
ncbi:MAG: Gfo/Idh/MocA family oxidoreductase [Verrucomicrobiales bacterium]|nr:Gfo/Idh/MocA family oxidoreductase [Verrucomicrobiales bacterium]